MPPFLATSLDHGVVFPVVDCGMKRDQFAFALENITTFAHRLWRFPSRVFLHGYFFINTSKGVAKSADLKGKRDGMPEYSMTAAVYMRGLLKHEYSVGMGARPRRPFPPRPAAGCLLHPGSAGRRVLRGGRQEAQGDRPRGSGDRCAAAADRVEQMVADAIAKGARLVLKPEGRGCILGPAIVAEAPAGARLMGEEAFGSVVVVQPVANIDAALALANASEFGLQGACFTASLETAFIIPWAPRGQARGASSRSAG